MNVPRKRRFPMRPRPPRPYIYAPITGTYGGTLGKIDYDKVYAAVIDALRKGSTTNGPLGI